MFRSHGVCYALHITRHIASDVSCPVDSLIHGGP